MKKIIATLVMIVTISVPASLCALTAIEEATCMRLFSKILDVQLRRADATSLMDDAIAAHHRNKISDAQFRRKARHWRRLETRLAIKASRLYARADRLRCLEDVSEDAIEFLGE